MMSDLKKLSIEELEKVTGGDIVNDVANKRYWLVKQSGEVLGWAPTEESAIVDAKQFGTSTKILTMDEYKSKYGRELKW